MRVAWVSGWGVAPESLRPVVEEVLPTGRHAFFAPVAGVMGAVAAADYDLVVGWSLGAWHLLDAASKGMAPRGEVLLLAPFVAFCAEQGQGGRCSQTQVRWLKRWLQRDPLAALADFYARAGLGPGPQAIPYSESGLVAGLDLLAEDASPALRRFVATGLPKQWGAVVGEIDPLLDASVIGELLRPCKVVAGAGHAVKPLLEAGLEFFHAI